MRIAQVAPCWFPIPPRGYGGIELVVGVLTDALVARGHDVTLFASGDSTTKAHLRSYYATSLGPEAIVEPLRELPHLISAYAQAADFDIVHDHTTFGIGPALGAQTASAAIVHTMHVPPNNVPFLRDTYELVDERVHLVALSDSQRTLSPMLRYVATVYNGIDVDAYRTDSAKDDYLLFVGRMCPEKGPDLAIKAARALGRRLLMGVKMHEPAERAFFETVIRPILTPQVEILGELGFEEKIDVMSRAACTLIPIQWDEPFGLVAIESLACGTPVAALRRGALPEIVDDGVTGVLADDFDGLIRGIPRAEALDPAACRTAVATRFSAEVMAAAYERVYERLLGSASARDP
jgi:glycosyltransferase involved in cell wall biosynthesis